MLGQRLNARSKRHQRLARRLRARHALFERRDTLQQLRAGRERGGALVRFLRPIVWTPAALTVVESPPDELLAPAVATFVEDAPFAAPEMMPPTTDAEVAAARHAHRSAEPFRAQPTAASSAPRVESRDEPVETQAVDAGEDESRSAGVEALLPQRAATFVADIEAPNDPASTAAADLTQTMAGAADTAAAPTAPLAGRDSVGPPSVPVEQRVARPPARRSDRATIAAELAPESTAPEPELTSAQPGGHPTVEPADLAEAAQQIAELPAEPFTPPSAPALSTPPESLDAEALFTPREPDARAPASWLERLTRAAESERASQAAATPPLAQPPAARVESLGRPAPARQRSPAADMPDTVTLPPSARRFLRPLVGVEPDDVPLRAGPLAEQAVAAQAADALAFEGEVVLGAEAAQTLDAPRTLGLLAHELTHVARRSAPRFVPPVARGGAVGPAPTDEETLAALVEARVVSAAAQGVEGSSLAAPNEFVTPRSRSRAVRNLSAAARPPATAGLPDRALPVSQPALHAPPHVPSSDAEAFDFGGLPAPWEPFPSWITDTFAPEPALDSPVVATASNGMPAPPPVSSAPLVQRAGEERSLGTSAAASGESAKAAASAPQPAPTNLDDLARQVYGILRRRLAAEARRAG